ncbi:cytochrome P450 [Spongisporangium articulatum]|uniref:Cytochrome P450 n=1 Tax=Spongisporangium articulatum TaxID=3362603 RepID=A0ABW8AMN6_9ACTN
MRNDWGGQVLPHPTGRRPFIGDVLGTDGARPLQSTMRRAQGLGPIFELKVFGQKLVFVGGAHLAALMCDEARFAKGVAPAVDALRDYVGDALFTAYDDEPNWRLAHDLLLPAFSRSAMRRYHPVMLQTVRELFDYWPSTPEPVDVARDMTKLTLETISRAAFSRDFGSFENELPHPFVAAMVAALKAGRRKGMLGSVPGGGLLRRRIDRANAHHVTYADGLLDDLIAQRRAEGEPDERDLLGIMLGSAHPVSGQRLDDLNIRHQILTFLVAGHETTSGALSFALYHLSRHPEALARAQAETDAVLGPDPDAEPTFEQVAKFRYLRRVLDESLRLWPTVPAFPRTPREELTLPTGHRMRPGDWALVLTAMAHRDPAVWGEDADEFDPDRFLPERSHGRLPHSYKPFGTGERACIGRQFALHEAVLVLSRVLHRYDIAGDPDYTLQITERLTLMPERFTLTLRPRIPAASAASSPAAVAEADAVPDDGPPSSGGCPVAH